MGVDKSISDQQLIDFFFDLNDAGFKPSVKDIIRLKHELIERGWEKLNVEIED